MKVLILGATGFIGSAILRRLVADGHEVTGLGRSPQKSMRMMPQASWIAADVDRLSVSDWARLIESQDAIVNCAGALQDGWSDDLAKTQEKAMLRLYEAAKARGGRFILQISARTDGAAGDTPFLATKRRADEALAASGLPFVILRPALVIGRNAHGGTALIRALASIPAITPLIHADNMVNAVSLDDVAQATSMAIDGRIAAGSDLDLVAAKDVTLAELIGSHRQWLGLPRARLLSIPPALAKPVTLTADLAGLLGWRSPLRSTAMAVMSEGVLSSRKTPDNLHFADISEALGRNPSGVQDLWFARLYLLKPAIILTLSMFWLLSGLIPLVDVTAAASHFMPFMSVTSAWSVTVATCLLDILLGLSVLFRPFAKKALLGMILVSVAYLAGGTLLEPQLWLDPIGPLVKVLPSLTLTLMALAILDER